MGWGYHQFKPTCVGVEGFGKTIKGTGYYAAKFRRCVRTTSSALPLCSSHGPHAVTKTKIYNVHNSILHILSYLGAI